jgi:hypothetical protein
MRRKVADAARLFSNVQTSIVQKCNACTVITTVLEPLEAFEKDGESLL